MSQSTRGFSISEVKSKKWTARDWSLVKIKSKKTQVMSWEKRKIVMSWKGQFVHEWNEWNVKWDRCRREGLLFGFFFFFFFFEETPNVCLHFSLFVIVPSLIVSCLPLRRSVGRPCVWVFSTLCRSNRWWDDGCGMVFLIPVFPARVWCVWFCTGNLLPNPELSVCVSLDGVCPSQVRPEDRDR